MTVQTSNPTAEFLHSVAQNDYMIDGHFLPTGERLNEIATALEHAGASAETIDNQTLAQLRRIDQAARVYVENRTHGNYSKLCDALFDGRSCEVTEQHDALQQENHQLHDRILFLEQKLHATQHWIRNAMAESNL